MQHPNRSKSPLILFLLLFSAFSINAQTTHWSQSFGSPPSKTDIEFMGMEDIQVDAKGNTYVTGYFTGERHMEIQGKQEVFTSKGEWDIFIAKLAPNGELEWFRHFGGTGMDCGKSLGLDSKGNAYLSASFEQSIDLDGGRRLVTEELKDQKFIAKFDPTGKIQWVTQMGAKGYSPGGILVDKKKNVYTWSDHFPGEVLVKQGKHETKLVVDENAPALLSKLDKNGVLEWSIPFSHRIDQVVLDLDGNLVLTTFTPLPLAESIHLAQEPDLSEREKERTLASIRNNVGGIHKIDRNGNEVWKRRISLFALGSIAVGLDNSLYIAGHFQPRSSGNGFLPNSIDLDPGDGTSLQDVKYFMNKPSKLFHLDESGNLQQVHELDDLRLSLLQTEEDGALSLFGSSQKDKTMVLAKLNNAGDVIPTKRFPLPLATAPNANEQESLVGFGPGGGYFSVLSKRAQPSVKYVCFSSLSLKTLK